jgi:hypothetical protein
MDAPAADGQVESIAENGIFMTFSLIVSLLFGLHTSLLALQWVHLLENMPIDQPDRHSGPG